MTLKFEEFCNDIAENIYSYLPNYDIEAVRIDKVTKNNGIECTGVIILLKEENVAPNIYLDYYYMLYKQGRSLDDILTMIASEYKNARCTMNKTNFNVDICDLMDNVIIKLVNYERNKEILKGCPYITFLDLAITFRFMVRMDEDGMASSLISNKDLERWDITKEELYDIALENTRKIFPARIRGMDELIPNMDELCANDEDRKILHILTNNEGINGATCLVYDEPIRDFAREIEKSIFIIPSSIHEVVLVSCDNAEKEGLMKLVKEVNKFIVSELDYLSDNVYFYDLETDKITI